MRMQARARRFGRPAFSRSVCCFGLLAVAGLGLNPATGHPALSVVYQASNVDLKVAFGGTTAVISCIRDARDGAVNRWNSPCNQVKTSGSTLVIDNARVFVLPRGDWRNAHFSQPGVRVEISGGTATMIANCVNDTRDGIITKKPGGCKDLSIAGNMLSFFGAKVRVLK